MSHSCHVELMVHSILLKCQKTVVLVNTQEIRQELNMVPVIVMPNALMTSNSLTVRLTIKIGIHLQAKDIMDLAVLRWTSGKLTVSHQHILSIHVQ